MLSGAVSVACIIYLGLLIRRQEKLLIENRTVMENNRKTIGYIKAVVTQNSQAIRSHALEIKRNQDNIKRNDKDIKYYNE